MSCEQSELFASIFYCHFLFHMKQRVKMKVEEEVTIKTWGKQFKLFTTHKSVGARSEEGQLPEWSNLRVQGLGKIILCTNNKSLILIYSF